MFWIEKEREKRQIFKWFREQKAFLLDTHLLYDWCVALFAVRTLTLRQIIVCAVLTVAVLCEKTGHFYKFLSQSSDYGRASRPKQWRTLSWMRMTSIGRVCARVKLDAMANTNEPQTGHGSNSQNKSINWPTITAHTHSREKASD